MARTAKGHSTVLLQAEGPEEPQIDLQQEEQPHATEGEIIADYNLDVDYEGLLKQK